NDISIGFNGAEGPAPPGIRPTLVHSGYSPRQRFAVMRRRSQHCYTSLRLGAPGTNPQSAIRNSLARSKGGTGLCRPIFPSAKRKKRKKSDGTEAVPPFRVDVTRNDISIGFNGAEGPAPPGIRPTLVH